MKENNIRKSWIEDFEQLKKIIGVRFGEEYVRNFSKIMSKLAQYHYKKKSLLLGKEREIYAFLIENGFKNVNQLHGGIIRYAKKFGSEHWIGKCLVFDNRNELDMDKIKE